VIKCEIGIVWGNVNGKPDTNADTKRYACNSSYASYPVYKPANSGISRWCWSSLTPV